MRTTNISDCKIINIKSIGDRKGHISVIENRDLIPFNIKRVFYLYDIPGGESRGAHAHKECHQLLVAASGGYQVEVDDGNKKDVITLTRPDQALHIPPGIWASEINFTSGAICLVLASHAYDEEDYFRNYKEFLKYKNSQV
jgi:dTDP-4-dehydrorhamnose 3,5-epimerase-like enzyme